MQSPYRAQMKQSGWLDRYVRPMLVYDTRSSVTKIYDEQQPTNLYNKSINAAR